MTLFGTLWTRMLAAGEAPRECMFAEQHSEAWHKAREECRRRVETHRNNITKENINGRP